MSIVQNKNAFVVATRLSLGLAQIFSVKAAPGNPAYLVLTALDRNEYTAGEQMRPAACPATGTPPASPA